MQTANPKTAQTIHGGNTHTTANKVKQPSLKATHTHGIASTSAAPAWAQLSFVKVKRHGDYYVCSDWLAVPNEAYADGWVTGYKAMAELMALTRTHRGAGMAHAVRSVMEAAMLELAKPVNNDTPDKRGAACAVMHCMAQFVMSVDMVSTGGNRCLPVKYWLQANIQETERNNALWAETKAKEKADWVQRMKAAKAAKKAARAVEVAA